MATSKSGGATRLGRDSRPKYLGLKASSGEKVKAGQILLRQRGTKCIAGPNVSMGKDYTLFATIPGILQLSKRKKVGFDRSARLVNVLSVASGKLR